MADCTLFGIWRQHTHKIGHIHMVFPSAGVTCTPPSQGEDWPHNVELLYINCFVSCPSLNSLALPCPALS